MSRRTLAVCGILLAGATGVLSATQTWLQVALTAGGTPLTVAGGSAVPVLAPLSLAALALGAVLAIVGPVLRHALAVLALLFGVALCALVAQVVLTRPVSAVAAAVTATTGITGHDAVAALIAGISLTAWPWLALTGAVLLCAAAVFSLVTARTWRSAGRRYGSTAHVPAQPATGPLDAVDSWDELSRGDDPTGRA